MNTDVMHARSILPLSVLYKVVQRLIQYAMLCYTMQFDPVHIQFPIRRYASPNEPRTTGTP